MPLAVFRGTRPDIPDDIPPNVTELWNTAQDCWRQKPGDRPSFPTILGKLDAFARLENITPFELREPRPMRVIGERSGLLLDCCTEVSDC